MQNQFKIIPRGSLTEIARSSWRSERKQFLDFGFFHYQYVHAYDDFIKDDLIF